MTGGICYRLSARVMRHGASYYVLYLHVRGAPPEVREVLERLARERRDIEVAIICP